MMQFISKPQPNAPVIIAPTAATPTFSPVAGTYISAQSITISCSTPSSNIFYTTDGSTPTTSSPQYTSPVLVSANQTLNAIATAVGFLQSAVGSAIYVIAYPAATPTFAPVGGTYTSAQSVTISCSTPSPSIFYTLDGSTPTTSSTPYVSPILVSGTETIKAVAIATGFSLSAVGSAAYIINSSGTTTGLIKFSPGDYMLGLNANATGGTNQTDMQQTWAGVQGYIARYGWPQLEPTQGSYASMAASILADYNYLQSQHPGSRFGVGIVSDYGVPGSIPSSSYPTTTWSNQVAPSWILNAPGGVVNVYNTPSYPTSSGPTTAYTMAAQVNGQYGWGFSSWTGTNYILAVTALWDPGVLKAWQNFWTALSQVPLPWAVASGGDGNTYTLDKHPLVECTIVGNETSYNFNQGPYTPNGSGANACTVSNYWNNFKSWLISTRAAWPHTETGLDITFQVTGADGSTDTLSSYNTVNGYLSASWFRSIQGWFLCPSDTAGSSWTGRDTNALGGQAQNSVQAFIGVQNPTGGVATTAMEDPVQNASLAGIKDIGPQIQTPDLSRRMMITVSHPASFYYNTAGGVTQILAAANGAPPSTSGLGSNYTIGATRRFWNPVMAPDYSYSDWAGYLQSTFSTGQGVVTLRPTDLMTGVTITAVTVASASSLTITWTPFALNPAETGLTYTLFRNGVSIATGLTSGTYTNTGLSPGTYTYTMAMANANGTGPQGAGVIGTLGWQRLLVGAGGYVRGMQIAADGTMVGRTDTNGAYLYSGGVWNQIFNVNSIPSSFINSTDITLLNQQGVFEIQIAATNTQVLYAIYVGLVWKSANRGTTWTQTAFTQNINGTESNDSNGLCQYGQHMAIDPNNANIVFVGTTNAGLSFTLNGGTSYTQVSVASVPVGTGAGITGIQFYGNGPVTGGATQTLYAASNGNGVYQSTNGGSTWGLLAGSPTNVVYSAIDASGNYYCCSTAGVLSKYNGSTWTALLNDSSGLQCFTINPFNTSEIVAVRNSGWLDISYDGGSTWPALGNYMTTATSSDIPWLAAANFASGRGIYLTTGGCAFSPVTNGQLIVSAGTGMWQMTVPTGATSSTPLVYNDFSVAIENVVPKAIVIPPTSGSQPVLAGLDRPFFNIASLTSYPSTYGPVNSSSISAAWSLDYASSSPGFVVGLADWFFAPIEQSGYSTNYGATWTNFASFPSGAGTSYQGGTIAASTPQNIIWAPADGFNPYYTLNQGASWTAISISGISSWAGFHTAYYFNQRSVTADRVNANTFYLYYPGNGVYITTNGGAAWTQQKSGYIESNSSWSGANSTILSVPGNAGNLFYTSGDRTGTSPSGGSAVPFYRSTNAGVAWTAVSNVTGVTCFNFGAVAPTKTYPSIYIVGFVSGVYGVFVSTDNADTWTNLGNANASLSSLCEMTCIAADPNNFGNVYIGYAGGGYAYYG